MYAGRRQACCLRPVTARLVRCRNCKVKVGPPILLDAAGSGRCAAHQSPVLAAAGQMLMPPCSLLISAKSQTWKLACVPHNFFVSALVSAFFARSSPTCAFQIPRIALQLHWTVQPLELFNFDIISVHRYSSIAIWRRSKTTNTFSLLKAPHSLLECGFEVLKTYQAPAHI